MSNTTLSHYIMMHHQHKWLERSNKKWLLVRWHFHIWTNVHMVWACLLWCHWEEMTPNGGQLWRAHLLKHVTCKTTMKNAVMSNYTSFSHMKFHSVEAIIIIYFWNTKNVKVHPIFFLNTFWCYAFVSAIFNFKLHII